MTTADDRCGLFVFDFFSTSSNLLIFPKKVIGPDASEKHSGSSGDLRNFRFLSKSFRFLLIEEFFLFLFETAN